MAECPLNNPKGLSPEQVGGCGWCSLAYLSPLWMAGINLWSEANSSLQ